MTRAEVARLKRKYEASFKKTIDLADANPANKTHSLSAEFFTALREYERKVKESDKQWKHDMNAYLKAEAQLEKESKSKKGATMAKRTRTRKKGRVSVKAHTRRYPR